MGSNPGYLLKYFLQSLQFSDLKPEKDFSKMNHKYNNIADIYRPYNLQKISWFPHQFLNGIFYFGLLC